MMIRLTRICEERAKTSWISPLHISKIDETSKGSCVTFSDGSAMYVTEKPDEITLLMDQWKDGVFNDLFHLLARLE